MGVTGDEQALLEQTVADRPESGDVIPGLAGLRKIRFAFGGRGKRGGGRAVYYLMLADDTALMISAYAKNEREDLSPEQRKAILAMLKELKND